MTKLNVYFYNGMVEPKLVATSITGLLRNVKVSDTYRGDCTKEMRYEVRGYKEGKQTLRDLIEALEDFNLYVNPTKMDLIDASRQWFSSNDLPMHHFKNFVEPIPASRIEKAKQLTKSYAGTFVPLTNEQRDYYGTYYSTGSSSFEPIAYRKGTNEIVGDEDTARSYTKNLFRTIPDTIKQPTDFKGGNN